MLARYGVDASDMFVLDRFRVWMLTRCGVDASVIFV